MKRSTILVLCLLIGMSGSALCAPALASRPNFVVILADDMGYGDIGPFGSKLNRTPNLDRLAQEGMKLTSFYSAPLCSASRAQLLTGCYAKRVSIPDVIFPARSVGLNPSEKTIATLLKPQGYATMCIGKWHLGDQQPFLPTSHGFDHYLGLPYSNNMDGAGKSEKARNPMPPLPLLRDQTVIEAPAAQSQLTREYTEEAVKFITANKGRPFFLYLPHTAVHAPLNPGDAFKGKSSNGEYGDWVEELDWSVGQVIKALKDLKLDRNTLVVFTSDNGATKKNGCNDPFRGFKGSTWEGGLREPAIAWWPGRVPAGATCDAMLSEMDILPTLVGLAGGKLPADRKIDGLDCWPVFSGQSKASPHEALYYFQWHTLQAVRSGPWKLAIAQQPDAEGEGEGKGHSKNKGAKSHDSLPPRLYNLDHDPGEKTDVAAQHPEEVKRLQALIATMDADLGVEGGKNGKNAPGIRPAGHVDNPKPLVKRQPGEYD